MLETFSVTLDGAMLRRGFYLYVWEITPPDGNKVLYVGRTGDSSSPNAQSLFNRLGQNLGTLSTSSMVRNNLERRRIDPEQCRFDMVGYGPIFDEPPDKTMQAHKPLRDKVGAAEKKLAQDLRDAGYHVMNEVRCNALSSPPCQGHTEPPSDGTATSFGADISLIPPTTRRAGDFRSFTRQPPSGAVVPEQLVNTSASSWQSGSVM